MRKFSKLLTISLIALAAGSSFAADKVSERKGAVQQASANYITTRDGVQLYYKDWGPRDGQPIVFSHGWPLNSDSWESQMLFLADHGSRVIAHDRRGHGRS